MPHFFFAVAWHGLTSLEQQAGIRGIQRYQTSVLVAGGMELLAGPTHGALVLVSHQSFERPAKAGRNRTNDSPLTVTDILFFEHMLLGPPHYIWLGGGKIR